MLLHILLLILYISSRVTTQSIIQATSFENLDEDESQTLRCHKKIYYFRVSQSDENGKECWDYLSIMACWGRCDSNEIADFRFPFKKSNHPVCVHYGRNKKFAILRNCEEGALPSASRYEYYEAADCKCQQCSSLDTSCEGPRYRSQRSQPEGFKRITRGRDYEDRERYDYYY
ncbi:thyrostimulin beta-5 subunit [Anthonomus grandis grandis]|uniref:thyrostimulin beta-5 subunit n=1 Tax=Anthonomus grandis grandis TaxID=2921223 RepID=UPI0021655A3F|nr:thyrostimulin beta-5 subunit [Anthonomus grandis grandis]